MTVLAITALTMSLQNTLREKKQTETSPSQNETMLYTNEKIGYTLLIPKKYELEQSKEKENVLWRNNAGQEKVSIRFASEEENDDLWFGKTVEENITLGDLNGKKYIYQHCQMKIFCSHTITYVIPHQKKFLGIEFRTKENMLNEEEKNILESFTLLEK